MNSIKKGAQMSSFFLPYIFGLTQVNHINTGMTSLIKFEC